MKNLKRLGKVLDKQEQKSVNGGIRHDMPSNYYDIRCWSDADCPSGQTCILKVSHDSFTGEVVGYYHVCGTC